MKVINCINSLSIYGGAEKIVTEIKDNVDGVESYELYRRVNNLSIMYKLFCFIKGALFFVLNRNRYDFFHFHLFPSFYLSIFIPRGKVIIHEHNTHNRRRDIKILKPVEKYLYRRAKTIICISEAVRLSLNESYGSLKNTCVLPNFTRFEFEGKAKKTTSTVSILMVASFTSQKKQDLLVRTLKFLPEEFCLDFAGDGHLKESIYELAKELDVLGRIIFHGNVDDISRLYEKCDFAVLLSNWEGFGMVVVEAASFEKVTLCTDVPGLSNVVDREDLLVDLNITPELLASKISDIHQKINRSGSVYEDYCKSLSKKYSFLSYKRRLLEVYERRD